MQDRPRRITSSRDAAEAMFKAVTTKPPEPILAKPKPAVPGAKEQVSLRIDRQESGPGWQDRINEALRKIAGK
jgi:uncharacterized protein (DUF4415 family)